MQIGKRDK